MNNLPEYGETYWAMYILVAGMFFAAQYSGVYEGCLSPTITIVGCCLVKKFRKGYRSAVLLWWKRSRDNECIVLHIMGLEWDMQGG